MIIWLFVSYLIGSIPIAKVISKQPLNFYSTSEVTRKLGFKKGGVVALVDVAKGILAVGGAFYWDFPTYLILLSGLSAVAGQIFPLFNSFKGGGGLFTSYGVLLIINPLLSTIAATIIIPAVALRKVVVGLLIALLITHFWAIIIGDTRIIIFGLAHLTMVVIAGVLRWLNR